MWHEFQKQSNKNYSLKKIKDVIETPALSNKTIKFLDWFSKYNLIPIGMSLKLHLLSGEVPISYSDKEYKKFKIKEKKNIFKFSSEQELAFKNLNNEKNKFRVHLLQGATGSGKTLVYFKSIIDTISKGFQALILLPEIGLTFEFEKKFEEFFGFKPAIWHSSITKKNKKIIWSGLASGKIKVVIGARSALFLPFKKIGEIIVDEEHDQSFKQDEGVIYNARDMAIARAKFENIPINLVSAVPSVETYENIINKKYTYSRILKRYRDAKLPKHEIINLKENKPDKKSYISPLTKNKVLEHLNAGDQILFFINRRGYSPHVMCTNCLKVFSCPNCSINLVYHKNKQKLLCHYCGFKSSLDRKCSGEFKCDLAFSGPGVEKVTEEINKLFPNFKTQIFQAILW